VTRVRAFRTPRDWSLIDDTVPPSLAAAGMVEILRHEPIVRGAASTGAPRSPAQKPPIGKVRFGEPELEGPLSKAVVMKAVKADYSSFRRCYENALKYASPAPQGLVTIEFEIGADGSASNLRRGYTTVPHLGLAHCVKTIFYSLPFPAPDGGPVRVRQPIAFFTGPEPKDLAALFHTPEPEKIAALEALPLMTCQPGSSKRDQGKGGTCDSHADCNRGLYCDGTTCAPERATGESCRSTAECVGRCVEGLCSSFCGAG